MKEFWHTMQGFFTAIGGLVGYYLGGCDGLLIALIMFSVVDYITGVMCGITRGRLSSEVGFAGIFRKVVIYLLVGAANILDVHLLGSSGMLRTAVIFFYLSNEGISILENACTLGLPIPSQLRAVLEQIKEKSEGNDTDKDA